MKKSLLALAVLASIAGVASAQSSVTIYGLVDAGVTYERGAAAGNVTKVSTGVANGNRLGFKGTEDLGNGLKANFQLENGFDLDTGTSRQSIKDKDGKLVASRLFGRQAWVGLSGNFGAVALGRQYSPFFNTLDAIDPFGTGLAGRTDNLMNGGKYRVDNSLTYASKTYGGFSATGLYGITETAGNAGAGSTVGLSGNFTQGPVNLSVAYEKVAGNSSVAPALGGHKLILVGGTFNFGVATAHVAFESEKGVGVEKFDYRDLMVGATVPVGPGSVVASFIVKDDRTNADAGAKQLGIGYLYPLSKRTTLYTAYAHIDNDRNATFRVGNASDDSIAVPAGHNSSAVNVGIRHKF